MVAGGLLSGIVTIVSLSIRGLWGGGPGWFMGSVLLLTVIVVGLSAGAAKWLQHLAKEESAWRRFGSAWRRRIW